MRHNVDMLEPTVVLQPRLLSPKCHSQLSHDEEVHTARKNEDTMSSSGSPHPSAPIDLCPPPPHLYSRNALRDPIVTAFFRFIATWLSSPPWAFGSLAKAVLKRLFPNGEPFGVASRVLHNTGLLKRKTEVERGIPRDGWHLGGGNPCGVGCDHEEELLQVA